MSALAWTKTRLNAPSAIAGLAVFSERIPRNRAGATEREWLFACAAHRLLTHAAVISFRLSAIGDRLSDALRNVVRTFGSAGAGRPEGLHYI
jgi:hypothetical protein